MTTAEPLSLTLTDPWPSRVRGGIPYIELSELSVNADLQGAGETLTLRGSAFEPIGLGIVDVALQRLWTMPTEGEEAFDERFLKGRIRRAIDLRRRLHLFMEDSACRLINGEGDGLPGFLVDVYAENVVIYSLSEQLDRYAPLLANVLAQELPGVNIISKIRPPGEVATGKLPFRLEAGEEPPSKIVVQENGVQYEVHLMGGLNTGLFCDMRVVREELRPWLKGKRVLNTFSYSGSFSVIAGLEEARSVVSVDFASGVLEWTKTNFTLNKLAPTDRRFKFERDDVFEFLKVARRHNKEFDVVILDPPATTTVPGRRWYLKSDYGRLISHALKVTASGGLVVVAASSPTSRPEKLESQIREAAKESGRRLRLVGSPGLPPDYPTQMIHAASRYLKCFFLLAD